MAFTYLISLPTELLIGILECCDAASIAACRLTCSQLNSLIDQTPTLQYAIELAANGMLNGGSNASVTHRRQKLGTYLAAWRELAWSESRSSPEFNGLDGTLLFNNIIAFPNRASQHPGGTLLQRFPSKLREIDSMRWHIDLSERAFHLDIDDAQDLCIYRLPEKPDFNIVALSSGLPHLLNKTRGIVTSSVDVSLLQGYKRLSIHHDIFAFVSQRPSRGSTIFAFNWKTGERLACIEADHQQDGFSFLDEHHVLVVIPRAFTPREGVEAVNFHVHDFHSHPNHFASIIECFRIEYPSLREQVHFSWVISRVELRRNGIQCRPPALSLDSSGHFYDRGGGIIALQVVTTHGYSVQITHVVEFELHILSCALMTLVAARSPSDIPPLDVRTCPFIRMTEKRSQTHSCPCTVAGMRAISSSPSREGDGRWVMKISDYHPGRVSRALALTHSGSEGLVPIATLPFAETEMVLEEMESPGTVPMAALFEDGVVVFEVDREGHTPIRNTRIYSF
ncbi:hypothetical protein BC834DRAFT_862274 [Gloeopeniophorella convolvens]|nr:hypothetical protein BC834DRAFT_862274 [Gloeopeniophorella convolvens]